MSDNASCRGPAHLTPRALRPDPMWSAVGELCPVDWKVPLLWREAPGQGHPFPLLSVTATEGSVTRRTHGVGDGGRNVPWSPRKSTGSSRHSRPPMQTRWFSQLRPSAKGQVRRAAAPCTSPAPSATLRKQLLTGKTVQVTQSLKCF